MITANGIGSGLDIDGIVTQLMAIEREPVDRLQANRAALDVELSAYASVRSAMSTLASRLDTLGDDARIGPFVSTSSDEDVLTATAGDGAAAEMHDIEVLALAASHRLASDPYASADDSIGSGSWRFAAGDNDFEIVLDNGADSLTDLRDAINDASDNDSVSASLLRTDEGTRLILTARESGLANAITATRPSSPGNGSNPNGGGNSAADAPFDEVVAASDARLEIDGFLVSSASNTVTGAIAGVTIELTALGDATLDTRRDRGSLEETLAGFASDYNALVQQMRDLAEDTLQGDRLPRNTEAALRSAFSTDIELGDGTRLSPFDLGFTFDRNGVLSLDASRRGEQELGLERYLDAFTSSDSGFAARLSAVLDGFTDAGARLDTRTDGIERRQAALDDQIDRYDYRLEQTEARYRRQFAAMDNLVGQLQSTSSFLADRLGAS